jgi:hypothetical protein
MCYPAPGWRHIEGLAERRLSREAAWPALTRAAELVEAAVEETLTYYAFPEEHCRPVRTNNPLERILHKVFHRNIFNDIIIEEDGFGFSSNLPLEFATPTAFVIAAK